LGLWMELDLADCGVIVGFLFEVGGVRHPGDLYR